MCYTMNCNVRQSFAYTLLSIYIHSYNLMSLILFILRIYTTRKGLLGFNPVVPMPYIKVFINNSNSFIAVGYTERNHSENL